MLINLEPRFAPAYRIKIGGYNPDIKKRAQTSGREYRPPVKWDHFKVCRNERDPVTGNFRPAPEIMKHYVKNGEDPLDAKPTSLNIVLFSNDLGDIFDEWRALYLSRRCQCRTVERFVLHGGDDREFNEFTDPVEVWDFKNRTANPNPIIQLAQWDKTQNPVPKVFKLHDQTKDFGFIECPERSCPYTEKKHCKVNSILRCMILEAPELGAVAEFRTTSVHSAMQLKKSLEMVYQMTDGYMAGIQLALRLEPKTVEQGTVFVAHVVYPHGGLLELKEAAAKFRSQELAISRQLLIAEASVRNFEESPEEAAHIDAEFYSEGQPGENVVESPTIEDEKEPGPEGPQVEESPEESETDALPGLESGDPKLSDESAEKAPAVKHEKCPFPPGARVDVAYCETDCKLSKQCEAFQKYSKSEVPWEGAEGDETTTESSPPAEGSPQKTFDLFR